MSLSSSIPGSLMPETIYCRENSSDIEIPQAEVEKVAESLIKESSQVEAASVAPTIKAQKGRLGL